MKLKDFKENTKRYMKVFRGLYRDKRTPIVSKVFLWIAIGYFVLPVDIIPDFIPVLGQLDDIILVPFMLFLAVKFMPKDLYKEHKMKHFL